MELRGIDPLTFRMQSGRSTTELQPLVNENGIKLKFILKRGFCKLIIKYAINPTELYKFVSLFILNSSSTQQTHS